MRAFVFLTVACFLFYLFLTIGTGDVLLWSEPEIVVGFLFSLIVAFIGRRLVSWKFSNKSLSPRRWLLFVIYLVGPFFLHMAKANLDVAYRVLTGRINPGIVKVKTNLKTNLATALLANSITLTPGTLTVDVGRGDELFIHWINVKQKKPEASQVYGCLGKWVKMVME